MTEPTISLEESKPQFDWPVGENDKATVLRIWNFGKRKQTNPHARAFWAATISFFFTFVGWFALAPLMPAVRDSIGICDEYTEYGTQLMCVCGPKCRDVLQNANICSVASTIGMTVATGFLLEKFGPRVVQSVYMALFAIPVLCAAFIVNGAGLVAVRFFIGGVGATFVTTQFWCSLMFAPSVVGTANATAAALGKLDGGVTQFLMPSIFSGFVEAGLSVGIAWRVSMVVPGVIFVLVSLVVWFSSQDTPHGKFHTSMLGKANTSLWDYVEALKDYRVVLMMLQYAAYFGTELQLNNQLVLYFHDFFQLPVELSGRAVSVSLAVMLDNFIGPLGGGLSDLNFKKWGMRGRLWIHFICLLVEGIMLVAFGREGQFEAAITCLGVLGLFVQTSQGTSYGIVPFMMPQHRGIVSALVAAGGHFGAVLAGFIYKYIKDDPRIPFQVHGLCVITIALTVPLMYWPHFGGMFCKAKPGAVNPHINFSQSNSSIRVADQSKSSSITPSDVPSPEDKT
ncbi:unnamed protein product [Vitrella brassicaformis CCMP3155]|uniref:Major facilitator superfamily (MFS) profile domain-containing protein n=1 Tax=Vitrella brassicaformis (strain CCMP3155) TaxID=1169540 RepID=A0A0G4EY40_VITBC|nr:unnamed protein product [Vitrella brassicaformis CCMP3155]|eukprot:CEM03544.1 unnamed protein product [Vitrella brassicaformis CCMP3155]